MTTVAVDIRLRRFCKDTNKFLSQTICQNSRFKKCEEEHCKRCADYNAAAKVVDACCTQKPTNNPCATQKQNVDPCANQKQNVDPCATQKPNVDACANQRRDCGCLNIEPNKVILSSAAGQIIGTGALTMKKNTCDTVQHHHHHHHAGQSCNQQNREAYVVPQRSRSFNAAVVQKPNGAPTANRHHSCSPSRNICLLPKSPRAAAAANKSDSNMNLGKMCADMNMSGLICAPSSTVTDMPNVPPPPPPVDSNAACAISATQVALAVQASQASQASTRKLFDDVRSHAQAKRQWGSPDEIENEIESTKRNKPAAASGVPAPSKSTYEVASCMAAPKSNKNDDKTSLAAPSKLEVPKSYPPPTPAAPLQRESTPIKRNDIPKMSLVPSFIPKEQAKVGPAPECKKVDDTTFKPPAETSVLEKGLNTVMTELKSITHNFFGKSEEEKGNDLAPIKMTNELPADSVKQRILKFQSMVNNNSGPRGSSVGPSQVEVQSGVKPTPPPAPQPVEDEPRDDEGKTPQQGIIRRVIDSIAQGGGIQGLSTLQRESSVGQVEKERRKSQPPPQSQVNHQVTNTPPKATQTKSSANLKGIMTTRAEQQPSAQPPIPRSTPKPSGRTEAPAPNIEVGSTINDSGSDGTVIDLTESLRGGFETATKSSIQMPSSPNDSDVEYVGNSDNTVIHTVSSGTRQESTRAAAQNAGERFQTMIHTEPSLMRHEEYNKFAKRQVGNAPATSSEDGQTNAPSNQMPVNLTYNSRRRTIPFRADQYGARSGRPVKEARTAAAKKNEAAEALQQDDGCVATSSPSESENEIYGTGQFVNAMAGGRSPVNRDGHSVAELSPQSKRLPQSFAHKFVDHIRGHDSGPTIPFSSLMTQNTNVYDDEEDDSFGPSTEASSFDLEQYVSNTSGNQSTVRRTRGLVGGSEANSDYAMDMILHMDDDEEENYRNYAHIRNGSEVSGASPFEVPTWTDSETPQSFQGPYEGTEYNADDGLRSLNRRFGAMVGSSTGRQEKRTGKEGGVGMSNFINRGKDLLMSKYVNGQNYLDGLQSSVDVSTNDEMSVTGTSVGNHPMKFFCSVSKSMDEGKPELNVNLMLVGNNEDEEDDDCGQSVVSGLSQSTGMTQATQVTVDDVYFSYSEAKMSRSMLMSLMESDKLMGGGECTLTARMDSNGTPKGKPEQSGFNDVNLHKFLDEILRSNNLLSASDEHSLASISAPALSILSERE